MRNDVTAVIPAYNAERFLPEAIHAALNQARPVREVIVVDDCSTDDSVMVARQAGAKVLTTATNSGPASARNIGVASAITEYVAFLDADDVWEHNHVEVLARLLEKHPKASVAFSLVSRFGAFERQSPPKVPNGQLLDLQEHLWRSNPVPQSAAMVRRPALQGVGGYTDGMRFAEDFELWIRVAREHKFVASNEYTVRYRVHEEQNSRSAARMLRAAWEVRRKRWDTENFGGAQERAEVERILAEVHDHDMRVAWHAREPEPLAAMLSVSEDLFPQLAPGARKWRLRRRLIRPAWLALARARDWLRTS